MFVVLWFSCCTIIEMLCQLYTTSVYFVRKISYMSESYLPIWQVVIRWIEPNEQPTNNLIERPRILFPCHWCARSIQWKSQEGNLGLQLHMRYIIFTCIFLVSPLSNCIRFPANHRLLFFGCISVHLSRKFFLNEAQMSEPINKSFVNGQSSVV